jgi:NAD(P)-dependent dehydrogenase (short-subunit alcohol dehydrogenase family)
MKTITAFITGANKGIGLETARKLAKAGYHIFLGSRDKNKGEAAIRKLQSEGFHNVELIEIDVSNEQSVLLAYANIKKLAGKLDVLVNNAGISGTIPQTPSSVDDDNVKRVFETNFFGVISVTRIFL